jgi:hypothetical protein
VVFFLKAVFRLWKMYLSEGPRQVENNAEGGRLANDNKGA